MDQDTIWTFGGGVGLEGVGVGDTTQMSPGAGEVTLTDGGALSRTVSVAAADVFVVEGGFVPSRVQPGPPTTTW
jgi:hypothetical protein